MRRWLLLLLIAAPALLRGQAPDQKPPAFEVASVKPNTSGDTSYLWSYRGDRFTAHYVTVKSLISSAFGAHEHSLIDQQIVGGPGWIATDHFDVEAKAPGVPESPRGTTPARVLPMLRSLLEQRFQLETHFEKRELPVYILALAGSDGRLGPRMRPRVMACSPCSGQAFPGTISAKGATMTNIVSGLERFIPDVGRVVVDQAGLSGTFDIDLNWTPEPTSGAASFFTALREQLGLKLESTKGPVDVLVIDHVEKPTPD